MGSLCNLTDAEQEGKREIFNRILKFSTEYWRWIQTQTEEEDNTRIREKYRGGDRDDHLGKDHIHTVIHHSIIKI